MASTTNTITLYPSDLFFDNQKLLTALTDGNGRCSILFPNLGYGLYQVYVSIPLYNNIYGLYLCNYNKTGVINVTSQAQVAMALTISSTTLAFTVTGLGAGATMAFSIIRQIPYY